MCPDPFSVSITVRAIYSPRFPVPRSKPYGWGALSVWGGPGQKGVLPQISEHSRFGVQCLLQPASLLWAFLPSNRKPLLSLTILGSFMLIYAHYACLIYFLRNLILPDSPHGLEVIFALSLYTEINKFFLCSFLFILTSILCIHLPPSAYFCRPPFAFPICFVSVGALGSFVCLPFSTHASILGHSDCGECLVST